MRTQKKVQRPFFAKHWAATLIVTALVCLVCYLFLDKPLAAFFQHTPSSFRKVTKWITDLIDPKNHYFFWPLFFFAMRYCWKKEIWANRSLLILVSIPMANLLSGILKPLFGRARPEVLFTDGVYGFTLLTLGNKFASFPSGHSCTIGALCGALACFYPRKSALLVFVALLLAFSRAALTLHFLSDIIAGVAIGLVVAQSIFVVMKQKPFQFVLK